MATPNPPPHTSQPFPQDSLPPDGPWPPPDNRRRWMMAGFLATCAVVGLVVGAIFVVALDDPAARSEDHLAAARRAQSAGQLQAAIIEYKNTLQLDDANLPARLELGRMYLAAGDGVSALKELSRASELGADDAVLTLDTVRAAALAHDDRRLAGLLTRLAVDEAATPEVLTIVGDAALRRNDSDSAQSYFSDALAADSDYVPALRSMAALAVAAGNLAAANTYIDRALANASGDIDALTLKAWVVARAESPAAALPYYQRALQEDDDNDVILLDYARTLVAAGRFDDASRTLQRLDSDFSSGPMVAYLRGRIAFATGQLDQAQAAFTEVLLAQPEHAPSKLMLGEIAARRQRWDEAARLIKEFIASEPGYLPATLLLGSVQIKAGAFHDAVTTLRTAGEVDATDPVFLTLLGSALVATGNAQEGDRLLAQAAALAPADSTITLQQALGTVVGGDFERGLAMLDNIADGSDGRRAALMQILLLGQRDRLPEAQDIVDELLVNTPQDVALHNLSGLIAINRGDRSAARSHFAHALELDQKNVPSLLLLARLNRVEGDFIAAEHGVDEALAAAPTDLAACLAKAQLLAERNDTEGAVAWLEKALQANSAAITPRLLLANHALARRDFDKGATLAADALQLAPENVDAATLLGRAHTAAGNSAEAARIYSLALQRSPDNARISLALAELEERRGDVAAAISRLQALADKQPASAQVMLALARMYARSGNVADAAGIISRLAATDVNPATVALLRGDLALAQGRQAEAMEQFKTAFDVSPTTLTLLNLVDALRASGDERQASEMLAHWLSDHPADIQVRLAQGNIAHRAGDSAAAISQFETALADDPENVVALNNLAFLLQNVDRKRAVTLARHAFELAPDVPAVLDTYGWLLLRTEQMETARQMLERALDGAPQDPGTRYHYAALLVQDGEMDRAREVLVPLLAENTEFADREAAERLLVLLK